MYVCMYVYIYIFIYIYISIVIACHGQPCEQLHDGKQKKNISMEHEELIDFCGNQYGNTIGNINLHHC